MRVNMGAGAASKDLNSVLPSADICRFSLHGRERDGRSDLRAIEPAANSGCHVLRQAEDSSTDHRADPQSGSGNRLSFPDLHACASIVAVVTTRLL